jgi:hypothetical protein
MKYKDIKRIVIAPQIVVYRDIFQHSKELINLLKEDHPDSMFTKASPWYENGTRRDLMFIKNDLINNKNSEYLKDEQEHIKEIVDIADFIHKDYFDQFGRDNGIWPSFIKDWGKVDVLQDYYAIDYFHYMIKNRIKHNITDKPSLMMDYHVDEFPIKNEKVDQRHIITINYYLNDEYTGGEICAYDSVSNKNYKYKPAPGDVVVMPSTAPFYHGVQSYYKFDRYFLRTFINYHNPEEWIDEYHPQSDEESQDEYLRNEKQIIAVSAKMHSVGLDGEVTPLDLVK